MNVDLPGRFVEVNGATIHYADHGDGAPLILIHGGLPPAPNGSRCSPSSPTRSA